MAYRKTGTYKSFTNILLKAGEGNTQHRFLREVSLFYHIKPHPVSVTSSRFVNTTLRKIAPEAQFNTGRRSGRVIKLRFPYNPSSEKKLFIAMTFLKQAVEERKRFNEQNNPRARVLLNELFDINAILPCRSISKHNIYISTLKDSFEGYRIRRG